MARAFISCVRATRQRDTTEGHSFSRVPLVVFALLVNYGNQTKRVTINILAEIMGYAVSSGTAILTVEFILRLMLQHEKHPDTRRGDENANAKQNLQSSPSLVKDANNSTMTELMVKTTIDGRLVDAPEELMQDIAIRISRAPAATNPGRNSVIL